MSDEQQEQTRSQAEVLDQDEKSLIQMLYQISIDDIRQLKDRQWNVTKWVLLANVALLIPLVIDKIGPLPTCLPWAGVVLGLLLAILGCGTIFRTQQSLQLTRERLQEWRNNYPAFKAAYRRAPAKENYIKFRYDWLIWVPMLAIALGSSSLTVFVAWHKSLPLCTCLLGLPQAAH